MKNVCYVHHNGFLILTQRLQVRNVQKHTAKYSNFLRLRGSPFHAILGNN
jgi:hypothetical protein